MHKRFDHKTFEKKWQEKWAVDGLYDVGERDKDKEKEYVLVEWPYPSGNLHIGHWYAFAVPDIYVRYQRMLGKQVLYPMGFDAFGLPAENAAIKRNLDPKEWTNKNIDYMRQQLASMGNAFTWNRTCNSTDPEYYKWTQWMFTQFFENNIAYRGEGTVNWCPGCNTVIANEQVLADGTCERSGDLIEKKIMPQWMLRITDFADELIDDLNDLDWPEFIKESQRNWIGRSSGAELEFALKGIVGQADGKHKVKVFTTRPDTLFGVTFLAISPELAKEWLEIGWQANGEVKSFVETELKNRAKKDFKEDTEKRGMNAGITAINPASKEEIPVWIVNYVLGDVGTGAVMGVPAHDERDNEFAKKFDLDIKQVIVPSFYNDEKINSLENQLYKGDGILQNSGEFDGTDSEEAKVAITEKVGGKMTNRYRLRDWSIGRQRYWGVPIPIVYDPEGNAHSVPKEHLPWTLPEDVDFRPTGVPPLSKSEELKKRTEEIFGKGWTPEVETMDTFVDSSWYFFRYLDNKSTTEFASSESQKNWMPIDMYFGGAEHTTMHLLYSRFWVKALKKLGLTDVGEPYKHRINRSLILGPDGNKMSKSKGNVVDPDEQVERVGSDTVKMYLSFMGPYAEVNNYPFDLGGIAGIRRFLERVYGLHEHTIDTDDLETQRILHKTIKKVRNDITEFKFNTAISAMMIFINHAEKEGLSNDSYMQFLRLLAPFAPHLAEELWSTAHTDSIHLETYPTHDEALTAETEIVIGVQINGKLRGEIKISPESTQEEAESLARINSQIAAKLENQTILKVIYVPGRILNFIVKND